MNNQEIIIPLQKEGIKAGLAVCFFMIVMLTGFFYVSNGLYKYLGHYITFFLQSIILLGLVLMFIGFVYVLLLSKEPEDLARLTSKGVWVRDFGFIPWEDIAILDKFQYGTPLIYIGIRVTNSYKLAKQASFNGKMAIFWSKIFGYPPIIIAHIEMDHEQIIAFAHRFMENGN